MDLNNYINEIKSVNNDLKEKIQAKLDNLTKPQGSLGRLEELAMQYCLIKNTTEPVLKDKVVFILAGDHGVTEEDVSAFPQEVTQQMVLNFLNNGAAINVLARHVGAKVVIADLGVNGELNEEELKIKKVNNGTKNMIKEPAMTDEEAEQSILSGISLLEEELSNGLDIAAVGEMGIGNTTSAAAITSVITGVSVENVAGKGTGITAESLQNKILVIKKAIELNKPDKESGIDVLKKVGGFEIGGIAGIILASANNKIPVIIDGFISSSAALIASKINPIVKDYLIPSHCSVEQGHKTILEHLGLKPLFDLNFRLGEGTGAALAIGFVEAGVKILNEMATFESAGVSGKDED